MFPTDKFVLECHFLALGGFRYVAYITRAACTTQNKQMIAKFPRKLMK